MRESRIPLWESGFHAFFSLAAAKRGYFLNRPGPEEFQKFLLVNGKQGFGIIELCAAGLLEKFQQGLNRQLLLLFSLDVHNDTAFVHHDEAVAETQSVAHIVRDHERREIALGYTFLPRL